jgi:AraC family transcriptional regulator
MNSKPPQYPPAYISSVNKAFQYIDANLDTAISLLAVAEAACFSPFHFHRIFKNITGETLNGYISRKRIERIAALLIRRPDLKITQLALQYGFTSISSFSRSFNKYYAMSPTVFRRQNISRFSKISKTESKNGQVAVVFQEYICSIDQLKTWIEMNAKIEVKEYAGAELAYVTSIGKQGISAAFDALLKWAIPLGLLNDPKAKMVMIYHDSFKTTDPDKVRISAAVTLNSKVKVSDGIGLTTIYKGKCIVGSFTIRMADFEKSWNSLFLWMVDNGYRKADHEPFEIYHNDYRKHPEQKCIVDLYIPVQS